MSGDPGWAEVLVKATLIVAAARILAACRPRLSASTRHLVQALALASLLVLPPLSLALPSWGVTVPFALGDMVARILPTALAPPTAGPALSAQGPPEASERGEARRSEQRHDEASNPASPLFRLWAAGCAAVILRYLAGTARMAAIARSSTGPDPSTLATFHRACRRMGIRGQVRLRVTDRIGVPAAWGIVKPTVFIPSSASGWACDRTEAALRHELAHVTRCDAAWLLVGWIARAIYWFHPLVWMAARDSRRESERACDDLVLATGARPSDYARHLLTLAREMPRPGSAVAAGLSATEGADLEDRLRAILHPSRDRRVPSTRTALRAAMLLALLLAPLASLHVRASDVPDPRILLRRGLASLLEADPEGGILWFRKALEAGLTASQVMEEGAARVDPASTACRTVFDRRGGTVEGRTLFSLGLALQCTGQYGLSLEAYHRALEKGSCPGATAYNLACSHARLGRKDEALEWLARAETGGCDVRRLASTDPDLALLRGDPRFALLRAGIDTTADGTGGCGAQPTILVEGPAY